LAAARRAASPDARGLSAAQAAGAFDDVVLFYVPHPARPLLRVAWAFLLAGNPDPRQRVFAGFSPMPPALEQAAERCGIALPRRPVELPWTWQYRARWLRLGESFQPATPSRGRPGCPANPRTRT